MLFTAPVLWIPFPRFIECSQHPERITYKHELLRPILEVTYGCIVYQEQVIQIFRQLAGFSLGQADMIRRAMSKKKHKVIDAERIAFVHGDTERGIPGAMANGVSEAVANSIYDEILDFASYAFNKAHAVSYAVVCYRTAYMKRHYPQQYMAALLTSVLDSSEKVSVYINECRDMGMKLLPPDINLSGADFTVDGNNIRFGLAAIKGVGNAAVANLEQERRTGGPFTDFENFCNRVSGKDLNRRAIENMILAGCFDSFGHTRRALVEAAAMTLDSILNARRNNIEGQMNLFGDPEISDAGNIGLKIPFVQEYDRRELMQMEKDVTGMYLSGHPMDQYREVLRKAGIAKIGALIADLTAEEGPQSFADGQQVTIAGVIESATMKTTKTGSLMCYLHLEDDTGKMELIVFQRTIEKSREYLGQNMTVIVKGRISARDEKDPQLMVDTVRPITDLAGSASAGMGEINAAGAGSKQGDGMFSAQTIWLRIPSETDPVLEHLRLLLTMFPGEQRIVIWCEKENKRVGARCVIHPALVAETEEILGKENVVLK